MPKRSLPASDVRASLPQFLSAHAAAELTGCTPYTIAKHVEPDAVLLSGDGSKAYPIWAPSTIQAYLAARHATV